MNLTLAPKRAGAPGGGAARRYRRAVDDGLIAEADNLCHDEPLRSGGVRGSNHALSVLARMINGCRLGR